MKKFNVPVIYRSSLITAIKNRRKFDDKLKKDFTPSVLDFVLVLKMLLKFPSEPSKKIRRKKFIY